MKTLTLQIPDNLDEREAKILLAAKLCEKGTLSLGQSAEMTGYSKRTFIELLADYEVSVFDYTEGELEKDLSDAKNYHI